MRRGERDPEHVGIPRGLIGLRPVLRAPLVPMFRRVAGVDLQEAAGGEQVRSDVGPGPAWRNRTPARPACRRGSRSRSCPARPARRARAGSPSPRGRGTATRSRPGWRTGSPVARNTPADAESPRSTRCSDRSRRPGRPPAGAIERTSGIPHGVPLREIYLIFPAQCRPGDGVTLALPAGPGQFGCRLVLVECQGGEFQLECGQAAG